VPARQESTRPHDATRANTQPRPYRGPDRRGVARFVVPAALPTVILVILGAVWIVGASRLHLSPSTNALNELDAIAATLAVMAGVACLLRWRLDGIARGWWCGWALLVVGVGQIALEPLTNLDTTAVELATFVLAMILIARAILGPEVDATIRAGNTLAIVAFGVALALVPAFAVSTSPEQTRGVLAAIGVAWLLLAAFAALAQHRGRRESEGGWIIPVSVAFALAELVPLAIGPSATGALAARWFALCATSLACIGALGGLVRAAVHHRTRALREQVERERETANHQRVEESFADRLHELRSTVVAIEGGVATWAPNEAETPESTLRAALIAEIRRLRTLVNEAPAAEGVEAFEVGAALAPTIALHRAAGQNVTFQADGIMGAIGRPHEIAQVVEGLLANAAKYAPDASVRVVARSELDEISIRVEDDGPGIDPEYWDRIFDRGFRIDPTAPSGAGLGLAVARKLLRTQDGDLWVEVSASGGAAFVLSLPSTPALRVVAVRADGVVVDSSNPLPIREAK
jgi:signal transduction histidine kinase